MSDVLLAPPPLPRRWIYRRPPDPVRRLSSLAALLGAPAALVRGPVGTATSNSGLSAAPSVTKPSAATLGRLLLVIVNHNVETVTTTSDGGVLAKVGEFNAAAGRGSFAIFTRVITGDEGSSFAFTLSSSQRWSVVADVYEGYDPVTIWDVAPSGTDSQDLSTTPICPGATTLVPNALVLALSAVDGAANGTFNGGPGGGFSERKTENGQQPTSLWVKEFATPGAVGDQTFSCTPAAPNYSMTLFSLKPAGLGAFPGSYTAQMRAA